MKFAKHISSGKIVSAKDANYKDFYGILLCPECEETLTLRKGYFRNGTEISSTFVHPTLDNSESCSQRQTWGVVKNSFDGKPLSQGQLRGLLQKNIFDAICSYYLCWSGHSSDFNHIGRLKECEIYITQAKTKITKFFQTEGTFTKQDAENIKKTERRFYEMQSDSISPTKHFTFGQLIEKRFYEMQSDSINPTGHLTTSQIIEFISFPHRFHEYMSVLYRRSSESNEYDEPSDCLGQTTEPRLKNLNKFVKTSKIILEKPNNIVFINKSIDKIKSESFSSFDKDNLLLAKHFNLVYEVAAFLFTSAQQDLVYKLTPYFITFPYQRRLKDTNSHWKEYEYCLEQVEEIFGSFRSKQFYYVFNSSDSSQYAEASKYVSYLLLNVVNILVRIDWLSWFAKWQS